MAVPRPDRSHEELAIRVLEESVAGQPVAVDAVPPVDLDPGIDHHHRAEPFSLQISDQPRRIGEAPRVPGEAAEPVHVVDVEIDGVTGDAPLAELPRNLPRLIG